MHGWMDDEFALYFIQKAQKLQQEFEDNKECAFHLIKLRVYEVAYKIVDTRLVSIVSSRPTSVDRGFSPKEAQRGLH